MWLRTILRPSRMHATDLRVVLAYVSRVRFSPELRDGVADGDITVSIRLWQRPKVRVGGRYDSDGFRIEVDSVEVHVV